MTRLWTSFVRACAAPEDTRPLAALRILLPVCVIVDLLRLWQVGLVDVVFRMWEHGGLSTFAGEAWRLSALGGSGGLWLVGLALVSMLCVAVGIGVRPAIVVGVLALSQLGHLYPPGDRAIDRIVRLGLLVLLSSQAHRRWALQNVLLRRKPVLFGPRAPTLVLLWLLVLVYMAAGCAKLIQQPNWLAVSGTPVLYRILADPLAGSLDHVWWQDIRWPFYVGAWVTVVFEVGAWMLLTRWRRWWGCLGVLLHAGIALTMNLGMFSAGMLSFYVVVLAEWWVPVFGVNRQFSGRSPR